MTIFVLEYAVRFAMVLALEKERKRRHEMVNLAKVPGRVENWVVPSRFHTSQTEEQPSEQIPLVASCSS